MIPFGDFRPDVNNQSIGSSNLLEGVVPSTDGGYSPLKLPVVMSEALPSKPIAAKELRTIDGQSAIICATVDHIYRVNTDDEPWAFDQLTSSAMGLDPESFTSLVQFRDNVVAFNLGMATQEMSILTGSSTALTGAPSAAWGMNFAQRVWAGRLNGDENFTQWSGIESKDFWGLGSDGADYNVFLDGGVLTGGLPVGNGAYIFQEGAIHWVTRVEGDLLMTFTPVVKRIGSVAHRSLAEGPTGGYLLSEGGFFKAIQGGSIQPIGDGSVDKWFIERQVDLDKLWSVQAAYDDVSKMVFWRYPTVGWASDDYTPRVLGFHTTSGKWVDLPVNLSFIFSASSPGYSLESSRFDDIDTMEDSLDSRLWAGGRPQLAGFDDQFRLVFFSGNNMPAKMQTADVKLIKGRRAFVSSFTPITEGTGDYTGRVGTKDEPKGDVSWTSSLPSDAGGKINPTTEGFTHRFEMSYAEGEDWRNAQGVEVTEATDAGDL